MKRVYGCENSCCDQSVKVIVLYCFEGEVIRYFFKREEYIFDGIVKSNCYICCGVCVEDFFGFGGVLFVFGKYF